MKVLRLFLVLVLPVILVFSSCTKEELPPLAEETELDEMQLMVGPAGPTQPQPVLPDLIITQVRTTLPPGGPCPILIGQQPLPDGTGNVNFFVGVTVKNQSPIAIPAGTPVQVAFAFSGLPTVYTLTKTQGFAGGQSRIYRIPASLTAATGSPIGLGARKINAAVDRPNNVTEFNENNNTDSSYKFCDDF